MAYTWYMHGICMVYDICLLYASPLKLGGQCYADKQSYIDSIITVTVYTLYMLFICLSYASHNMVGLQGSDGLYCHWDTFNLRNNLYHNA